MRINYRHARNFSPQDRAVWPTQFNRQAVSDAANRRRHTRDWNDVSSGYVERIIHGEEKSRHDELTDVCKKHSVAAGWHDLKDGHKKESMKISKQLLAKLLGRFTSLIAEGDEILKATSFIPGTTRTTDFGLVVQDRPSYHTMSWPKVVEWRTKAVTLLSQVLSPGHPQYQVVEVMHAVNNSTKEVELGISTLKAIKSDLEEGFLDSLFSRIAAEVSADYLGQAEGLLSEGQMGRFDHVPAAVLTGAVLEKALRTLCVNQEPEISIVNPKGETKTLNPLIDDLKKAGVFNELRAKQLRAWADIRNKAAHGEFEQFTKTDVEQKLRGVTTFLSEYVG